MLTPDVIRVIELANLIGGTYIIGLSSHWRKLERESMRDIFLQHYLEPTPGREYRRNVSTCIVMYMLYLCQTTLYLIFIIT